MGDLSWRLGNLEDALHYSRQSAALFNEIGLHGVDAALHTLGNIALTRGDLVEARRQFGLILQPNLASNTLLNSNFVPWALAGMAEVLHEEGRDAQALELIDQVLRHPNNWQETKECIIKLRNQLATYLSAEVMDAAQARSQSRTLETVVAELFAEQPPGLP